MDKKEMRHYMLNLQSGKNAEQMRNESELLCKKLEAFLMQYVTNKQEHTNRYHDKLFLAAFFPRFDEPDIRPVLQKWEEWGHHVALPVIQKDTTDSSSMNFHYVYPFHQQIHQASMGLMEPDKETEKIKTEQISLILVPGVAFSKDGKRLGRGKGYYDRFLGDLDKNIPSIAPVFSWQLVENIPTDDHDQKVHFIISSQMIWH